MILDLSEEAKEYGRQALRAFEAAGGDQLVQQAEAEPRPAGVTGRARSWPSSAHGISTPAATPTRWKPRPRCAAAPGTGHCPIPVAERLAEPADLDVDGLVVVADDRPSGVVAASKDRWAAVTMDGHTSTVIGQPAAPARPSSPSWSCRPSTRTARETSRWPWCCPCWTLLGMLDRAMELTIAHVSLRKQFGQPLSAFQGVQFQLTDAEVERSGALTSTRSASCSFPASSPQESAP